MSEKRDIEPLRDRQDADGNPVTLERLCRIEPEWAASRIRHYEARVRELEQQVACDRVNISALKDDLRSAHREMMTMRTYGGDP